MNAAVRNNAMDSTANPTAPPRRWFRFGLRMMLLMLTVISCLAWLGWRRFGYSADEADNKYVGLSKDQIVERLGPPNDEEHPSRTMDVIRRNPERLVYRRMNGWLWIDVWDESGRRICFASGHDRKSDVLPFLLVVCSTTLFALEWVRHRVTRRLFGPPTG